MSRNLIRLAFAVSVLGMAAAAYGQTTGLTVTSGKPENEAPRFYGFTFDFTVSDSSGLNSVGQNYSNDLIIYFEPTWNIGKQYLRGNRWKNLQLAGRFVVTQNLAGVSDSNFNGVANAGPSGTCWKGNPSEVGGVVDPNNFPYCNPVGNDRRTDYSDLWLTLRAPKLVTIPKVELPINPSIRIVLPTSEQSRFQTLAMSLAAGIGTGRSLPFWKDRIKLGYSFLYNKNFHTSPGSQYRPSPNSTTFAGANGSLAIGGNPADYIGPISSNYYVAGRDGAFNNSNDYSFTNIFSGSIQFHEKVSFDALYILSSGIRYGLPCDSGVVVQGQSVNVCQTGDAVASASGTTLSRPGFSHTQTLWVTLNYQVLDYLGLSVAWINSAPLTYKNGSYRQGVVSVDYDAFTSVSLSATLTIDAVVNKLYPKKSAPSKQAGIPSGGLGKTF